MNTKRDFHNKLLKRREIEFEIESNGNPGSEKIKDLLVEKIKATKELIVVKSIHGNFGSNNFSVEAFVYESPEVLNRVEISKKKKKGESK